MPALTSKVNKRLLVGAKFLVGTGILYFFYHTVFTQGLQAEMWMQDLWLAFRQGAGWLITGAFLLIILNWGLEAKKWQQLVLKVEKVTFWKAFRAVLIGISLGFITPNRLGDYAGRILELRTRQRLQAFGAIFLGRFCQLSWTVMGGSLGFLYFISFAAGDQPEFTLGIGISLFLLNSCFLIFLFHPRLLVVLVTAMPILKRLKPYITIISLYSPSEIGMLFFFSGLRYLVFVGQFALLLYAFGVQASWWQVVLGIASTFLFKSVVPSFNAFTDLGMRELSAMYFFSLLQQNKVFVMSASLSLWFLNIALPSLIGLVFIWRLKIKNMFLEVIPAKNEKSPVEKNKIENFLIV